VSNLEYLQSYSAHKELLKEDLALRISESINLASDLFDSIAFSEVQEQETEDIDGQVYELEEQWAIVKNPEIKRQITMEIKALKKKNENASKKIVKVIDGSKYRHFIKVFYQVWVETKDQIKERRNDEERLKFRYAIANLFHEAKEGVIEPRKALFLFEQYFTRLEECGILKFTYSTGYVKGEKFRSSIG
jgi:hypothetical protein